VLQDKPGVLASSATTSSAVVIGGDSVAPVISSLSMSTMLGETTASATLSTDEANGTLWWRAYNPATNPSDADVYAGTGALVSGSQSVTATGSQSVSMSGLTGGTDYEFFFYHADAAANKSNVLSAERYTWSPRWLDLPATNGSLTPTGLSTASTDYMVFFLAHSVGAAGYALDNVAYRNNFRPVRLEFRSGDAVRHYPYGWGDGNSVWPSSADSALYFLFTHVRNGTSRMWVKNASGAWESSWTGTKGDIQLELDASAIVGPIRCARYAVWFPASAFDLTDSANRDLFVDPSTHLLKHPSVANAVLGTPQIHIGDRKKADVAPDLGSWAGTWTIGSAVADV